MVESQAATTTFLGSWRPRDSNRRPPNPESAALTVTPSSLAPPHSISYTISIKKMVSFALGGSVLEILTKNGAQGLNFFLLGQLWEVWYLKRPAP